MQRRTIETARGAMSALVWDEAGSSAPWLHFGHATGMHAHLYQRFLAPLAGAFNIVAADFRGHGESPFPVDDRPANHWQDLAEDTLALIDAVAPGPRWWLLGHSLGAVCGMVATTLRPDRVAGLMMLDPPLLPARPVPDFGPASLEVAIPLVRQALRRRPHYPDRASIEAAYRGRGVFQSFSEQDLIAYLDGGLVPGPHGLHLRCTPHWEAANFNGMIEDTSPWPDRLTRPFSLLAGETGSTVSDADLARFAAHPLCREARRLPRTDHFLPLQDGETIRNSLVALVRS
ncbi:alpha/beta hydrolase [Polymorphobacter sp.]|uniref:alpha/beta hydrolase n=1 Tax=Polymorphobacter sp. TaxID=1909290 RepID=UPI003F71C688